MIGLDLKVDEKYIAEVTQNLVKSSIMEALGGKDDMVQTIVTSILQQKVDSKGRISTSSYDKTNILEFYMKATITELAKEEIKKIVETKKESLRDLIKKELTKKKSLDGFIKSFIESSSEALSNSYSTKINIDFTKKSEY